MRHVANTAFESAGEVMVLAAVAEPFSGFDLVLQPVLSTTDTKTRDPANSERRTSDMVVRQTFT